MGIFKDEYETKRVIFNINMDIAERLEKAKKDARRFGKKLDIDETVSSAVEKFLKRAEKKLAEMQLNEKKKRKKNSDQILAKENEPEDEDSSDIENNSPIEDESFN
ncbi:hypothetical protein MTBBW1_790052 [Desulfamplus magnetovallimortis]|uniref:Uncharacterized protein n=1 Tax=Desulfamplus magnetovallimortis TaxID=1246637 RepID=A0A1W1HJK4_9BACT|nr:hypothetical protein [Desulfamplus magnetovallimortis]SLM32654.1 hypothetical protein MTBBW1_790052 [Desulfamplus magnetovallimortis]